MLDWLRLEFGIDKPSQKLQDVAHLDADALAAEVKKARGRSKPLSAAELKRLKTEHATSVVPLQTLAGEAHTLEDRVSDLVTAAYGLTPDEIALMWQTAPRRPPFPRISLFAGNAPDAYNQGKQAPDGNASGPSTET